MCVTGIEAGTEIEVSLDRGAEWAQTAKQAADQVADPTAVR
jgi:hypothetical protein